MKNNSYCVYIYKFCLRWKTCEKLIFCYIVISTIILALIVRQEHKMYFQSKKSQINYAHKLISRQSMIWDQNTAVNISRMGNVYMTKFNI